jgi:predicted ATP-grasp superfamily ATP-dependent carboligase
MQKVIVFGTGVVAYGVIEASARAGFYVIHLSTKRDDIAARSRLIDEGHIVDIEDAAGSHLLRYLDDHAEDWRGALIIPVNDPPVVLVSKLFEEISKNYVCCAIPWGTLAEIVNKNRLYVHAHEIGVPAPRIITPTSLDDLRKIRDQFAFPCILKPFQTPQFFSVFNRKVHLVRNVEELEQRYLETTDFGIDVMVSEIIPGPVENLFVYTSCLNSDDKLLTSTLVQKIRQDTEFGVGSAMRTVEGNDELEELSLRLLRHFSYRGFSAVEFKKDPRDGKYKLIEINTRPVLFQRLFLKAGINMSKCLYDEFTGRESTQPATGNPGNWWMHNTSELYALKRCASSSEQTLKDFFRPYFKPHIFALPALRDPGPLWSSLRRILRQRLGRTTYC